MLNQQLLFLAILVFLFAPAIAFAGSGHPLHPSKRFPRLEQQQVLLRQSKKGEKPETLEKTPSGKIYAKTVWHLPSSRK